jgi:hypothetical protein
LGDMLYVDAAPRHLGAGVMEALWVLIVF